MNIQLRISPASQRGNGCRPCSQTPTKNSDAVLFKSASERSKIKSGQICNAFYGWP